MMRIKLFGLFIAFALLALVRPRKALELLEAADGFEAAVSHEALRAAIHHNGPPDRAAAREKILAWGSITDAWACRNARNTECTLPPSGWRCTRAAGHDGPCAAVPQS